METILFLGYTEPTGTLGRPALEALNAAVELSKSAPGELIVGFVGQTVDGAAKQVATCGASQVLAVSGTDFANGRYATDAAAAEALCRASKASIVISAATSRANRSMAGVARRLKGGVDTHVTGLKTDGGKVSITRWYYRQRMEASQTREQRPWIVLIDPGSQPAWTGAEGSVDIQYVKPEVTDALLRTQVIGIKEPASHAQTIRPDADLLFVAGAGWTKKQGDGVTHVAEAEQIILNFLNLARASLGSTKSLVDWGGEGEAVLSFLTHFNQVGQTGSTPRHPKGLAACCHGEEPHTVGWRFVNQRRAINLDPNCGWARGKADVLYVGDAFKVMSKVNELMGGK